MRTLKATGAMAVLVALFLFIPSVRGAVGDKLDVICPIEFQTETVTHMPWTGGGGMEEIEEKPRPPAPRVTLDVGEKPMFEEWEYMLTFSGLFVGFLLMFVLWRRKDGKLKRLMTRIRRKISEPAIRSSGI